MFVLFQLLQVIKQVLGIHVQFVRGWTGETKIYCLILCAGVQVSFIKQFQVDFDLQCQMEYHNAYRMKGVCFRVPPPYHQMPNRAIITNVPDPAVTDNSIKTSKYNFVDFIPLNLMVQFSKLPNIYFLIIGIMQMIPTITNSGGFPVIFIPLFMVVACSALKDLFQDLKRRNSDNEINSSKTLLLEQEGFKETTWETLQIGDIVKIRQNQQFPADVILLQSSEDKLNCFIQTKNLDGETNLKYKQVKYDIGKDLKPYADSRADQLYGVRMRFDYQRPNPFIYSFTGSHQDIPLDNNNIVLRGCTLKITKWVTGVVVYTGVDTKIMLNSNKSRQKKSRLQFKMGLIVIYIFIVQMGITFLSALIAIQYKQGWIPKGDYIDYSQKLFVQWGSWILLFTNFVPISMIVTLQMVKYLQGINISNCYFMTSEPSEVRVQTSTLNQELGQIQHVFSDKTGTLTRNYMSFKYMVIGSDTYGYDDFKAKIPAQITNVDFHDQQFLKAMKEKPLEEGTNTFDMMVALSLCHGVIIEENQQGVKKYNASSPDELAFINMAKYCGWQYLGVNDYNQLCVKTKTTTYKYQILHTIEFDSNRKRMSVILQKNGRIFVYCKGADNMIIERLRQKQGKTLNTVNQRIQQWSKEGLRTLLFAKREIDKQDYLKWAKMYARSLSNLQKKQQEQKVKLKEKLERKKSLIEMNERQSLKEESWGNLTKLIIEDQSLPQELLKETPQIIIHRLLNDNSLLTENQKLFIDTYFDKMSQQCLSTSHEIEQILEKEFQLIGATAIEDQLQENVKQTIECIRNAGVKVWMLTGDKKETAINIGISCGLVEIDMPVVAWQNNVLDTIKARQVYGSRHCCLVATGDDLLSLTPQDEMHLLELVNSCSAIICCRVTPKQKQDMVWLMRSHKCTTLSIGDGANDVNMINTAHVGVGIKGVEGAQAALCSDYAISEFQILRQLLLYHGRQSYRKNSQLILFNFYKNLLLSLPQFWYGVFNNYSSATIYDPWVYQLYNVAFTSLPIMIYAIYDQQHSVKKSLKNPELYQVGLKNQLFNVQAISFWFITTAIYALILMLICFLSEQLTINEHGLMLDFMTSGMTIFLCCVIIANLKIFVLSYTYSWGLIIAIFGSIGMVYVVYALVQAYLPFGEMRNILHPQVSSYSYWGAILACVGLILTFQMAIKRYKRLKELEQRVRVEFVEHEIELSLLQRNPNSMMHE